jgi:hypothetical protein
MCEKVQLTIGLPKTSAVQLAVKKLFDHHLIAPRLTQGVDYRRIHVRAVATDSDTLASGEIGRLDYDWILQLFKLMAIQLVRRKDESSRGWEL